VIARQNLVSVRHEQLALEERCNVVNLQLLGPRLELLDRDLYARRVLAPLMSVQLDLLLDNLSQEERDQLFVVGRLVDVFSEALERSASLI
jgi:hypothetical protein